MQRTHKEWAVLWLEYSNEHLDSLEAYVEAYRELIRSRVKAKEVKMTTFYDAVKAENTVRNHYKDNLTRYSV